MTACLKKRMIDSTFTISGLLQNIKSIQEDLPLIKWVNLWINWVYSAVEVKESNSVPAFELTCVAHQFLHLTLKSPITIKQNGDAASIFDMLSENFGSSSQVPLEFHFKIFSRK